MSTEQAAEQPKKRAVRKRATITRATRQGSAERATRVRAPRARASVEKAPKREEVEKVEKQVQRKAPTPIAAKKARSNARRNQLIVVAVLFFVGVGASAAVGFTDKGQIDVSRTIEERNERIRNGQIDDADKQRIVVPVQNTNNSQKPNGGLVPIPQDQLPAPVIEEVASTTASTTDATASSTDEVASSTDEVIEETEEQTDSEEASVEEESAAEVTPQE